MGNPCDHLPSLRICAVISRHEKAFEWAREQLMAKYGAIAMESDRFDFSETKFYVREMGENLMKQFFGFADLHDPVDAAEVKCFTNVLEKQFAIENDFEEVRPLNLDPGYITEAKLVLTTTKDRDHRIYLRDGIYAEVTLYFQHGEWKSSYWTYPDYQRADFQKYFSECRSFLRKSMGKE